MILAIVEAGFSRPRSPEMMMAPILGQPFIWRQLERVRQARTLTKVVVALSRDWRDNALAGFLVSRGQPVFRSNQPDLLTAYRQCVQGVGGASHVVSLRLETPLIDPGVIDEAVRYALACRAPFVSNALYPRGLEVEVFRTDALAIADAEAEGDERRDPGLFFESQPHRFDTAHFKPLGDYSWADWTVHTPAAFAFVRAVFEALYPFDPDFGVEEALDFLAHRPDLGPSRMAHAR